MAFPLLLKALLLGVVEGLTEFLPVSSTGHLIIAGDLLDFTGERAKAFEIFIQLGSILAVVWLYRRMLFDLAARLGEPAPRRFVMNVLLAFIPAAIVGLAFHRAIKEYLFGPTTVAAALIAGGLAILLIERRPPPTRVKHVDGVSTGDAIKVGLAQVLALFPGVSRAGATILGGMVFGLSRTAATEFSFLLAIPTMFAATLFDLWKSRAFLHAGDALLFAVGFVSAFLSALIVIRAFLVYVGRHDFIPFAWYRIALGIVVFWHFRGAT